MCPEHICICVRYRKQQTETECGVWSLEVDWWAGWEMALRVFLQLWQDRGKQSGSGNPPQPDTGQKGGDQCRSWRHSDKAISRHSGKLESRVGPSNSWQQSTPREILNEDTNRNNFAQWLLMDTPKVVIYLAAFIISTGRPYSTYIMRLRCKVYPSS